MRKYFLTGATGTVGGAVFERLAARSGVEVVLLIRAESERALEQRFQLLCRGIDIKASVSPILGDITLPAFGLSVEQLEGIRSGLTNIVHAGASVRMNLSLEAARETAVSSANTVFDIARSTGSNGAAAKVEFLSTVGVNGTRPLALPEEPVVTKRQFHNTYEAAKAEAELIALAAIESGLPVTVHRPSMIVGDSRTGRIAHFQIFYHICEFLTGSRTKGFLPSLHDARLDVVPVDYVAEAVLTASEQSDLTGRFLHLCSGPDESLLLDDLRTLVRRTIDELGYPAPSTHQIPRRLFGTLCTAAAFFSGASSRRKLAAVPHLLSYLGTRASFINDNSDLLLRRLGVSRPSPRDYIGLVLGHYFAHDQQYHYD